MDPCLVRKWPLSRAATLWRDCMASRLHFYSQDMSPYRKQNGFGNQPIDRSGTAAERFAIGLKQVGRISGLWAGRSEANSSHG